MTDKLIESMIRWNNWWFKANWYILAVLVILQLLMLHRFGLDRNILQSITGLLGWQLLWRIIKSRLDV